MTKKLTDTERARRYARRVTGGNVDWVFGELAERDYLAGLRKGRKLVREKVR